VLSLGKKLLEYDPNFSYDDGDEEMAGSDDDGETYSDDDDSSWKVGPVCLSLASLLLSVEGRWLAVTTTERRTAMMMTRSGR
jgi:hypothetical protein